MFVWNVFSGGLKSDGATRDSSSTPSPLLYHSFLYPHFYKCSKSALGFICTSVLLPLPLSVLLLYEGIPQRWRRRHTTTARTASHSDFLTYDIIAPELIGLFSSAVASTWSRTGGWRQKFMLCSAVVSVPKLCWALRGSHSPRHLPETENRDRPQGQKYQHWLRLAAVFLHVGFVDFIQPRFTLHAFFLVLRLWYVCYILLHPLCPPCSHSPRAGGSGWRQDRLSGPPYVVFGDLQHCFYIKLHLSLFPKGLQRHFAQVKWDQVICIVFTCIKTADSSRLTDHCGWIYV